MDSVSCTSSASSYARASARRAALKARAANLAKLQSIELEELKLKQAKDKLRLQCDIDEAEAEETAYREADQLTGSDQLLDEYDPPLSQEGPILEDVFLNRSSQCNQNASNSNMIDLGLFPSDWVNPTQSNFINPPQANVNNPMQSNATGSSQSNQTNVSQSNGINTREDNVANDLDCLTLAQSSQSPANDEQRTNAMSNAMPSTPVDITTRLLKTQEQQNISLIQLLEQQRRSASALTLPNPVLKPYDGDPAEYCEFVHAFKHLVVDKAGNDSTKLHYLIQYTKGDVQELMRSCLIMKDGYNKAMSLLEERYGKPYIIATAHVKRLVNGPIIKPEDGEGLRRFSINIMSCVNTLQELGCLHKLEAPDNLRRIIERLPYRLRSSWRDKVDQIIQKETRDVNIKDISDFVTAKARATTHPVFGQIDSQNKNTKSTNQPRVSAKSINYAVEGETVQRKCHLCSGSHWLSRCEQFKKKTVAARLKFVQEKRLCRNCLSTGHYATACPKGSFCKICTDKHSTFLHPPKTDSTQSTTTTNTSIAEPNHSEQSNVNMAAECKGLGVSLAAVPVKVKAKGGDTFVNTYAFLDSGSNTTFGTEALLCQLGAKASNTNLSLTTMNGANSPINCKVAELEVYDLDGNNYTNLPRVYSRPSLPMSKRIIANQEDVERWQHLKGINLRQLDAGIGLLIGSDVPQLLQPLEVRTCEGEGPYATRTRMGWVVNGPIKETPRNDSIANFIDLNHPSLDEQFRQFCRVEFSDVAKTKTELSVNDRKALTILEESAQLVDGHYQIALPWKSYPPDLPNNKSQARRRLESLQRKLERDETVHRKYTDFMETLVTKGHARKLEPNEVNDGGWYLPHHPVLHPQKPDKVRVVFDCSAKYGSCSLNDKLLQGPDLTNTLIGVLMRFRLETIAFMADVESMFYQVNVTKDDAKYLKYLWWPDGDLTNEPEEYQMLVHLFGGVSSPTCANFALQKTANDNLGRYDDVTTNTVRNNFYVDDCLKSVATEEQAITLSEQLRGLLNDGGFRLTKWVSNSKNVLEKLPKSEKAPSVITLGSDIQERALGVQWNVGKDYLGFNISPKTRPLTRRGILSVVSSVYDPMGFASPGVLPAKLILQDLCRQGIGWDDAIPCELQSRWNKWLSELTLLEDLKIPRCYKPPQFEVIESELHHFSDASTIGYGAASYLVQRNSAGEVCSSLIIAKSRLAPIKSTTIPRLELTAAVISTRLDAIIREELSELPILRSVFWTDSTCVLKYLRNEDARYQTFVANRVSSILRATNADQWRHVDTKENPADLASRGIPVNMLIGNKLWFEGPDFLKCQEHVWPQSMVDNSLNIDDPEIKAAVAAQIETTIDDVNHVDMMMFKFSSWERLTKTVAWILRYKTNLMKKARSSTRVGVPIKMITVEEIKKAENEIIKYIQRQTFKEELRCLEKNQEIMKSSSICKLDPIIKDGLLRVGGRLQNAPIHDDSKHQVILPKCHHVVKLLTRYYHVQAGHSGTEHTLSLFRQRFWPVNGRVTVKSITRNCFQCKKRQAPTASQKMASLPVDRVTPTKPPFTYVGVDCFGPFEVKRGRVKVKRYGVIFTCLAIRAVHIEIAHSLDTSSFINALRRFVARRGKPEEIRSDNGGNFVKGEKELRAAIDAWNHDSIHDYLLQRHIKWKFNPPAGSHHGGVWERCIRTVRKVMKALIKEQILDDEGLCTLMCEVESIVNSRPITKTSNDPQDDEALTPNHLLMLRAGPNIPPTHTTKEDIYCNRRWRQVQYMADVFWRRWVREYLPTLQERQKWNKIHPNVKVDDIILLLDENMPRSNWPLGRVLEVYKNSSDGLVRSIKLKTASSTLVRPIDKIVLLETSS